MYALINPVHGLSYSIAFPVPFESDLMPPLDGVFDYLGLLAGRYTLMHVWRANESGQARIFDILLQLLWRTS